MKKIIMAILVISSNVFADITIPNEIPVDICSGLRFELESFATDLERLGSLDGQSEDMIKERFEWILVEVSMALAEEPSDCKYALKFTKRKHRQFLDEYSE